MTMMMREMMITVTVVMMMVKTTDRPIFNKCFNRSRSRRPVRQQSGTTGRVIDAAIDTMMKMMMIAESDGLDNKDSFFVAYICMKNRLFLKTIRV